MTFVNQLKRPFVVGVLRGRSADDDIANILNSECEGADAFDLHIHWLPAEQRDEKKLRRIFSSTKKPCLALFYREGTPFNTPAASEETRIAGLMRALECGAAGVDIQADYFDKDPKAGLEGSDLPFAKKIPNEVTLNPEAIGKQRELIRSIHNMGKEVLLSSHVGVELSRDEIISLALEMEKRGPDIIKIVTPCADEDYDRAIELLSAINELKKRLHTPFVCLGTGTAGRLTRITGAMLGNCLVFANLKYESNSTPTQPLIRSAVTILREASRDVRA